MNIQEGKEFLRVVTLIKNKLAKSYVFGIYEKEDIEQEIMVKCLEAYSSWDKVRPLYSFLLKHANNRLINLKRDEWYRATCPCQLCSFKEEGETGHSDGKHCKLYLKWKKRNSIKSNIASPPSIPENYELVMEDEGHKELLNKEIRDLIDEKMPSKLREIYLKIVAGVKVSRVEREEVLGFLRELLNGK